MTTQVTVEYNTNAFWRGNGHKPNFEVSNSTIQIMASVDIVKMLLNINHFNHKAGAGKGKGRVGQAGEDYVLYRYT